MGEFLFEFLDLFFGFNQDGSTAGVGAVELENKLFAIFFIVVIPSEAKRSRGIPFVSKAIPPLLAMLVGRNDKKSPPYEGGVEGV